MKEQYIKWLVSRSSNMPSQSVEIIGSCDKKENESEMTRHMLRFATLVIEEAQKFEGIPYVEAKQHIPSKDQIMVYFTLIFKTKNDVVSFIKSLKELTDLFQDLINE